MTSLIQAKVYDLDAYRILTFRRGRRSWWSVETGRPTRTQMAAAYPILAGSHRYVEEIDGLIWHRSEKA